MSIRALGGLVGGLGVVVWAQGPQRILVHVQEVTCANVVELRATGWRIPPAPTPLEKRLVIR